MGNNRIFYGCLGVALATPSALLPRIQSANISGSQNIDYVIGPGGISGFYSNTPDITCSYTQIILSFEDFTADHNEFIDLYMVVGPDNESNLTNPTKYILCRYLLLDSIEYNLSVDNFFTMTKTFKGFSRYVCDYNGSSPEPIGPQEPLDPEIPPAYSSLLLLKQNFNVSTSSLPTTLLNNPIQNITIKKSFNRKTITESGTRTPYAFVSNIPTETTVSVEMISQNLDEYNQTFSTTACASSDIPSASLDIDICSVVEDEETISSINFQGYVSTINYSGGDASGGNQTINIEYIQYDSSTNLVEFPNAATTGCFES